MEQKQNKYMGKKAGIPIPGCQPELSVQQDSEGKEQ